MKNIGSLNSHRGLAGNISIQYSKLFQLNQAEWKEELFQEAMLGMARALNSGLFDPERGAPSTFLWRSATNQIRNFLNRKNPVSTLSLSEVIDREVYRGYGLADKRTADPLVWCMGQEEYQKSQRLVGGVFLAVSQLEISEKNKMAFFLRYLPRGDSGVPLTFSQIAKLLGVKSRQRAEQMAHFVWKKIKNLYALADWAAGDVWLQFEIEKLLRLEELLAA
ncbi:MAG: sigma-70 family RNA polymerase sigma factor [Patescibacteria group bacterium]